MTLSDRDLSQMDTDYLDELPEGDLRPLSKQLLADIKEARERLKQSPETSSRPPSSREPWQSSPSCDEPSEEASATAKLPSQDSTVPSADDVPNQDSATPSVADGETNPPKKAGRRLGSPGHGRNLTLPVTRMIAHRPACGGGCGQPFAEDMDYRRWNARYELELEIGSAESPKLQIEHCRHDYFSAPCLRMVSASTASFPGACAVGHTGCVRPGRFLSAWTARDKPLASLVIGHEPVDA